MYDAFCLHNFVSKILRPDPHEHDTSANESVERRNPYRLVYPTGTTIDNLLIPKRDRSGRLCLRVCCRKVGRQSPNESQSPPR